MNCLQYFIHGRKARSRSISGSSEVKMTRGPEELPSYTDLFGNPNTRQSPPSHEIVKRQVDVKSEVSSAKSWEKITPEAARCMQILEEVSGRKQVDDRGLTRLAAKCRGCQITAHVAGAYIAQTKTSCGRYIRTIREKSELSLHSALSLTLDHIKKINPDAAQLFMFFAYFDHADLAYDLVAAASVTQSTWLSRVTSSVPEYENTMRWLQGYGIVDDNIVIYSINPLVHQWLSQSIKTGPLFSTFSLALRCVASAQEIVIKRNCRGQSSRFTQHAQHLATVPFDKMWQFAMRDPNCIDSIILLAHNCLRQKQVDRAAALDELVIQAPCLSAINMSNLAKNYAKRGQKSEAEQLYKRALDLFRADHKSYSIVYLTTLRRLDHLSHTLTRTEECESILKNVLNVNLQKPHESQDASEILRAYAELGMCRHEQRRYDEAIALYRATLEDYESLLDPHDSQVLFLYKRIGDSFKCQGEYDKAGSAYGRVLSAYSQIFGRYSQPRRKMATRVEKVALAFTATEEGRRLVKGVDQGSPRLKQVYTRWGCRNA